MNLELYVFDAGNQKMINSLLQMDEFRDLDLIIGPVYPELQETVASFAAKNRIPMISPLSSSGNLEQNNPWYFKVNPSKEYQIEQTALYASEELRGKNFILLQASGSSTSADAQLAKLCKEKLATGAGANLFHEYNLKQQGINAVKPLLAENGENIFIIPTDNEAHVSMAVTNLTALAEHYNIVLLGTQALPKLKSIQTENYHRIRLRYLSPYLVDYARPQVRRFVGRYRETYSSEPSQFSFQGFDVAYYFMSALYRYGKDFRNCLPDCPMELTQMNFNFERVAPMGGYVNHSLFVTGYERNFDVLNLGAFGGHSLNRKK
jgi:ABC-type branched-subunit amino acid transport system substrate-binding protein